MNDLSLACVDRSAAEPAPDSTANASRVDSLAVRLERAIRDGQVKLPVLPQVAVRVQTLVEREQGAPAFVRVIEQEPTIAAALLKYANSAMYSGLRDVTDLQQAIMRLGLQSVQQTVLALSAKSAFNGKDPQHRALYQTLWSHSLMTGIAARRLAGILGVAAETAFLAGLLHDIGKIVVLEGIATLRRRDPASFSLADHTVPEFMDALHCHLGDVLGDAWNIPMELRQAMVRHHDVELAGPKDSIVAVVQIADLMAVKMGASLRADPDVTILDKPASRLLQLDDMKIAMLLVDLEDDREALGSLF